MRTLSRVSVLCLGFLVFNIGSAIAQSPEPPAPAPSVSASASASVTPTVVPSVSASASASAAPSASPATPAPSGSVTVVPPTELSPRTKTAPALTTQPAPTPPKVVTHSRKKRSDSPEVKRYVEPKGRNVYQAEDHNCYVYKKDLSGELEEVRCPPPPSVPSRGRSKKR